MLSWVSIRQVTPSRKSAFFCHEVALVVEVDGRSHDERGKEDSQKEAFLREQQRLQVLRVSNDDVLKETEAVLFAILRAAGKEVV